MELFKNKVAIVTGGGSGIGRGISRELASRGAKVVVADINGAGAEETAGAIRANGGSAKAVKLDVTVPNDVRTVIDNVFAEFGRLDYMFNNAGIGIGGRFEDLEPAHWKQILDVNLWGVIYGSMYAYRVMLKQGFGHIINTASLAGLMPMGGTPYPTTKHGVVGMTLSLRIEAAMNGIKASVVCPGIINTPIFDTTIDISNQFTEEEKKEFLSKFKMTSPEECARVIMKGIKKNRAIITVTRFAWIFWRLYRMFPELLISAAAKQTKKLHDKRMMVKE